MAGEGWGAKRVPSRRNHMCKDLKARETMRKLGGWGEMAEGLSLSQADVTLQMCPTSL